MNMKDIRVHFQIPDSLYEELLKLENGKYKNITSYIRGITHDHLTRLIQENSNADDDSKEKQVEKQKEQDRIDKMYEDIIG